ncbi:small glutamine-rich tetratricopeptide repeat-containing protein alpha [Melanotaenia boesemani]|uniref:small glutamine-rich tetratricopeptide repeat-containing protein alpha n=1 Tax=Melanotaenia boesemani TaxID=1250792 RepID=UPI001C04C553|nr:small glutamine-rich tetratricopeptide repeat-containing protein alpha [Melanotaenia boesemani]XP_041862024.1 small glutamine-rich tetratricopeptide repeat-containing protein alpha [Melanotaenia boesemani]
MTDNKRLAFSIIQFLHDQLRSGNLSSDAQESLEVAVQCLETAFEVSTDDQSLAVPMTLPEIFSSATAKFPAQSQVNNNSTHNSPTEEQRAEAERMKSDGNDQMKVENFAAAVEFYSKAVALNPQNAVYYCNRAAAYSKLGNYAGAVQDCEQAIRIDPNYSKAYGRMGLALASLNKHSEAVSYYKKALELDPDNDTYKTNLKIAEEKMETSSPTAGMGGVDLAGLLSNPGFMNMASTLMNNPQVQQLMSGMMSGAYGGMGGMGGMGGGAGAGGGGGAAPGAPAAPPAGDLSGLIQAGQQFAQQMQQQNPELIEQLRSQIRNRTPSAGNEEQP